MQDFAYIARNMQGVKVSGTVAANSERDAINILSGQSLFPVSVSSEETKPGGLSSFQFSRRVKPQLVAQLYEQLGSLLRSGVPLLRSLKVIRDQTKHPTLATVLDDVYARVEEGETLADAMSRYPRVFGEMGINMVRAGGEGGFLEDALERVADFTEQQDDLKGRTMGALAYPMVLTVIGSTVVTLLIVFIVPRFAEMFDRLRKEGQMPWMTEALLWLSGTLGSIYGLILFAILVGTAIWLYLHSQTEKGRWRFDYLKLRAPMYGPIAKSLAVARFCRVLGTLMKNGVSILRALEISSAAAGNVVLAQAINSASENISSGQSLSRPLASSGHFPPAVIEMISVAEEANSLDTVLVEIAEGLERRTFRKLDLLVRLLEPIMLLVMAGIVLMVVVALLLPMFRMFTTM